MSGKKLWFKRESEERADKFGVNFKSFISDYVTFGTSELIQNIKDNNQTLYFSGTRAYYHNGFSKRAIYTITLWDCAMILHSIIICTNTANADSCPFDLEHTACL